MKSFLLFTAVLLFTLRMNGQHIPRSYPDSLEQLLPATSSDTGKAQLYFLLSDYWSEKDSVKTLHYMDEYFRLGIHDDYYNGLAHFYLAGALYEYDHTRSQQEYMTADKLLGKYNTPLAMVYRSRAWHNYGTLLQMKDDNRGFIDILLNKAIPLALAAGDSLRMAWAYKEVGQVLMNFGEYGKAHAYYGKALQLLRHQPYPEQAADCYISVAKTYLLNDQVTPAAPYLDSARQILPLNPISTYWPTWYWIEGMYLHKTGRLQPAIDSLDKGLQIANSLARTYDVSSILFEKYYTYRKQNKLADAKKALLQVRDYLRLMPLTNNMQQILNELAQTDADMGNPASAYQWLRQYTHLSDSLHTAGTAAEIANLEARFRTAEKEKEIAELHAREKIQQILLLVGVILFCGSLLFLAYRFRQGRRQTEQQLKSLQQQQQIEIANALLRGEERERGRIARDLHDGLGGMLAGIKIHLSEMVFNSHPDAGHPQLHKVIRQVDHSVKELRHIAHNLMPESLMRSGLEVALNDLCESVATGTTRIVFQMMNISASISQQKQLLLYRIVQELLANVLKHAHASEVFVQCSQTEETFYITVEDDGTGFDKTSVHDQKGMGLENIRTRVDFLRGKMDIDSEPGKGTIINIEINVT